MVVLPPGTLLQLIYLGERLKTIAPGRFVEIGPGSGEITQRLLQAGWNGVAYDLEGKTIASLEARFTHEIALGRLAVKHGNYLETAEAADADLIISCMVMEHLEESEERAFMAVSAAHLRLGGRMIGLVPASPNHWGIEDDIAGHCRRYTRKSLMALVAINRWQVVHMAGLTFPVSNLLLPISNFLVHKQERKKLSLTTLERTKQSGRRLVRYKTNFPSVLALLLNKFVLWPFHILQKIYGSSEQALVLYFEAEPLSSLPLAK